MKRMTQAAAAILALVALAASPQDRPAEDPDRVLLLHGAEVRGRIEGIDEAQRLVIRRGTQVDRISLEEIARIRFDPVPAVAPAAGEKVFLVHGGTLGAGSIAFAAGEFSVTTPHGSFKIRRRDVRRIEFGAIDGAVPEIKDDAADVVVSASEDGTLRADAGELLSLGPERLRLAVDGAEKELPRPSVRALLLRPAEDAGEPPAGWFARVTLAGGDRLVGTLAGVGPSEVQLFSAVLGRVALKREAIRSLAFVPVARTSAVRILVGDQSGLKEYDFNGRQLWSYTQDVPFAYSARRLESGNILVSNSNRNQVMEIQPKDRSGGEVLWRIDNLRFPYEAQRLENGRVLVAEFSGNCVSEIDPKDRTVAWSTTLVTGPTGAERLPDGRTLISSSGAVIEVDASNREVWRFAAAGIRPWRATRLENGNTLVVDSQGGQVVEVSAGKKQDIVWKRDGLLRPMAAVRLDDGRTLVLEQQGRRVVEIDFLGRSRTVVQNLNNPMGMSAY